MCVVVDCVVVEFVDWCDFGGCVGEECFVGCVDFVVCDVFFDYFDVGVFCECDDCVVCDVVEV